MKIKLSRIKEIIQDEYFNLQKESAPDETDLLNQMHHDTNATPEDIKQFVSGKSPVGYAINPGGPHGMDIKSPFWKAIFSPKFKAYLVLSKVVGGYNWVLHDKHNVKFNK